jgi:hypothetical protein
MTRHPSRSTRTSSSRDQTPSDANFLCVMAIVVHERRGWRLWNSALNRQLPQPRAEPSDPTRVRCGNIKVFVISGPPAPLQQVVSMSRRAPECLVASVAMVFCLLAHGASICRQRPRPLAPADAAPAASDRPGASLAESSSARFRAVQALQSGCSSVTPQAAESLPTP